MSYSGHSCEICGGSRWHAVYEGPIRDGAFGNLTDEPCAIRECGSCGAHRLDEQACRETDFYEGEEYRKLLGEPTDVSGFWTEHDAMQLANMAAYWPTPLRGKRVADIGCGAGSFLDHVKGLPAEIVAIEPCKVYHESLRKRGYRVYPFAADAMETESRRIDFAFSFSVIEHVPDPRAFLSDIGGLIGDEGRVVISTPNRDDVLMSLLDREYPQFFYRTVHRWYFDAASIEQCAAHAGFEVSDVKYVHRFGLSNAMAWLRDHKPTGETKLPGLDSKLLDDVWKRYLEQNGIADYMYVTMKPSRRRNAV